MSKGPPLDGAHQVKDPHVDVDWNGRKFGQLSKDEQQRVMAQAARKVSADFARPAMQAALEKFVGGKVTVEVAVGEADNA